MSEDNLVPTFGKEAETISKLVKEGKFTKAQIQEYREVFDLFDSEQSGRLIFADVLRLIRAVGEELSTYEFNKMVINFKENSDEDLTSLDFADVLIVLSQIVSVVTDNEIEIVKAFKIFDLYALNTVPMDKLKDALTTTGEKLSSFEWAQLVTLAGLGRKDPTLNYRNFVAQITRRTAQIYEALEKEEMKKKKALEKELDAEND